MPVGKEAVKLKELEEINEDYVFYLKQLTQQSNGRLY